MPMTDFDWTRRRFLWTAGMATAAGLTGTVDRLTAASGRRRKIILDVDTGTDDAVALMFGALHPELELVAATTVNGNVPLANCTENTLRVFDYIGVDVPVHPGLASPYFRDDFPRPRKQSEPSAFHGRYLDLPEATSKAQEQGAVDFLIETYSRPEGREITLVPVGPLSNVAMALKQAPEIVANIPEIVIMGGAHEMGNVTASAEFNVWADPEAARVVLGCGVEKITMVALDATTRALVSLDDAKRLRGLGTAAGEAAARFVEKRVEGYLSFDPDARPAAPVHDALAVASIVDPAVIETRHAFVDVETESGLTVGRTVVDWRARSRAEANVHFALGADEPRFVEMLLETMGRTA
jgi:inosine-uridine nucleoside N-ribohydrolase